MTEQFTVRDQRNGDWYWIDKDTLCLLSREGGPSCVTVYNWLALYANNDTQKCFPSFNLLVKESGLSHASIARAIAKLIEIGAVTVEGTKGKKNIYTLVKMTTSKEIELVSKVNQSQNETRTSLKNIPELVSKVDRNNTNRTRLINKTNSNATKKIFELPEWIDVEVWQAFLEMRKGIRASPTEYAKKLLVKDLDKLKQNGEDPNEVLNQSISRNWRGVFAVKKDGGNNGRVQESRLSAQDVYRRDYEEAEKAIRAGRTS